MKNLCITQDSKSETHGLKVSRGVWKGRPLEKDVSNTGYSPFHQEEPGLLNPLENVKSPRLEKTTWAGSKADAGSLCAFGQAC